MATSFFFKAVAPDGKVRTGTITAETDKGVAQELRRQGLTPVYVGSTSRRRSFELKLPSFGGGKRRGVLFFTQELSTLLPPASRSIARSASQPNSPSGPHSASSCRTCSACSRAASRSATVWPRTRIIFRTLHQHGARGRGQRLAGAGLRAAVRIRAHARRAAQLHHRRRWSIRRCWRWSAWRRSWC